MKPLPGQETLGQEPLGQGPLGQDAAESGIPPMSLPSARAPLGAFAGPALLAGLAALAGVGLAAASGTLITKAALRPEVFLSLMLTVTLVRALGLGRAALRYAERVTSHAAALRWGEALRLRLFGTVARFGRDLRAFERGGDLLARAQADTDAQIFAALRVAFPLLSFGAVWLALLLTLGLGTRSAGLTLAATGPLLLAALHVWSRRRGVADLAARRTRLAREHATTLLGSLHASADGAARLMAPRLDAQAAELERLARAEARAGAALTLGREGLYAAALGLTLWQGAALLAAGSLSAPLFVAVTLAVAAAFDVAAGLSPVPAAQAQAAEARERAGALEHLRPLVVSPPTPAPMPASPASWRLEGVTLRRGGRTLLERADLEVRPGECVALTGPSGSGKTTLASLFSRDLDPDEGQVTLGGTDLRALALPTLRRRLSLHEQRPGLLGGRLDENLRLADPAAPDGRLRALLDSLGLAHLPLDLWVSEDGPLSGGERARVSLARALLAPGDLLVLDEPTAHLDPDTEAAVLGVIARERRGRALLLISHRPAPLALADTTYSLGGGELRALPAPSPAQRTAV